MKIAYYHVDCFTENLFCGNPAAVCVMEQWPSDTLLQAMAREYQLPATAFILATVEAYTIRWFSPEGEIELCGHGSIAAAFVVFNYLKPTAIAIRFQSPLHTVDIVHNDNDIILNFPVRQLKPALATDDIIETLDTEPLEFYHDDTCLTVLETEQQVRELMLNMTAFRRLPYRNLIITAAGNEVDFVSRNFYINKVLYEDSVTGSAHCVLAPYCAKRLNKQRLNAVQVSARGGELICEIKGERVYISGKAILYKQGEIIL